MVVVLVVVVAVLNVIVYGRESVDELKIERIIVNYWVTFLLCAWWWCFYYETMDGCEFSKLIVKNKTQSFRLSIIKTQ